jgi:hypothetical protein
VKPKAKSTTTKSKKTNTKEYNDVSDFQDSVPTEAILGSSF